MRCLVLALLRALTVTQEPVAVRRLILGRDAQPAVTWIKALCHVTPPQTGIFSAVVVISAPGSRGPSFAHT